LGLAPITDLEIAVSIEPPHESALQQYGEVQIGSTACVTMSEADWPMDYGGSDLKRVTPFAGEIAVRFGRRLAPARKATRA